MLDKLDKIGKSAVIKEMSSFISKEDASALLQIVTVEGTNVEKAEKLGKFGSQEIKDFLAICQDFSIPEKNLSFDPSLARGLDYYTGIIFEVYIPDVAIGAVCAGGRYADLCSLFCEKKFSGVGVAFGFDRIVLAMEELKLLAEVRLNSQVMMTNFDGGERKKMLELATRLQSAGINTEIYFETAKLGKQFKYADKKEIPFVVICGPEEIARQEVTIKVMKTGKQKTIPQSQLVEYLNGFTS
ncbi:MAG: Histidine-tRNA ligase [Candidatus Peregrinibacteria bacterium GW2011_GWA2_47_7]|nr:MAG: Histidine-tRNA ligase [Candidatus Peregrinibacteria bacterium GW2011_GWA2_47_7]